MTDQLPNTPHCTDDAASSYADYSIEYRISSASREKYIVTAVAFSFNDSSSFLLLWSRVPASRRGPTSVFLFGVGRFGDWKINTVADSESVMTYPTHPRKSLMAGPVRACPWGYDAGDGSAGRELVRTELDRGNQGRG